jgi:hypothetical protein
MEISKMEIWKKDELSRIADTDDLHIAPFREDGVTYGTPTWIWSVVVDGNLFARAYNGTASRWYKAALRQKAGRITAGGLKREVSFASADDTLAARIDGAYKAKYASSPYLASMIGNKARAATIVIHPAKS